MGENAPTYRFAVEHFSREGRTLGQALVTPDFQPARECARFEAARRGILPLVTEAAAGEIVPIWCDELGPPHCTGIRVLETDFSADYFLEAAQQKAGEYREKGEVRAGDPLWFRVCAYPAAAEEPPPQHPAAVGFGVESLAEPIALGERSLAKMVASSEEVGDPDPHDAPVFVAAQVLREVQALSEQAGDVETGGVLVGRLDRDSEGSEIFAEVVAQIPARYAEACAASFAFTPDTWAAAHAALALRGRSELVLGWWHSHPHFCRSCPEEKRESCRFARPFFSADDVHLHRTCFPQAWQLALLVSELRGGERVPALFGWRMGRVVARSFRTLRQEGRKEGRCRG